MLVVLLLTMSTSQSGIPERVAMMITGHATRRAASSTWPASRRLTRCPDGTRSSTRWRRRTCCHTALWAIV